MIGDFQEVLVRIYADPDFELDLENTQTLDRFDLYPAERSAIMGIARTSELARFRSSLNEKKYRFLRRLFKDLFENVPALEQPVRREFRHWVLRDSEVIEEIEHFAAICRRAIDDLSESSDRLLCEDWLTFTQARAGTIFRSIDDHSSKCRAKESGLIQIADGVRLLSLRHNLLATPPVKGSCYLAVWPGKGDIRPSAMEIAAQLYSFLCHLSDPVSYEQAVGLLLSETKNAAIGRDKALQTLDELLAREILLQSAPQ